MSKRKFNAEGAFSDRGVLRMVNAGGQPSTNLRRSTQRRYKSTGKSLKAMINRAVNRTEEKKESNLYSLNQPLPPSSNAGWTSSSISIAPSQTGFVIPQGTGQGNRIGNKVRTKSARVRGVIHPLPYDGTTNTQPIPTEIRMLIFKDKFNRTGQPAGVFLDLFQTGSTSIGPQNDLVDMILEPNRDRYQIYHDEVLKVGFADYAGTVAGQLPTFQFFANNDFKLNAKFDVDITKFIPKVVTWNDSSAAPMTDNLWMIFLPAQAGGGQFGASQIALTMSWSADYMYTDA